MVRTIAERLGAVRALVEAARTVVHARAEIVAELVASSGLSMAGVELALARHLELDPTDAELESLVERAGEASAVYVILSANVFVGALRAIAMARAASARVVVRPSRREPVFARALVRAVGDAAISIDESLEPARIEEGEVHVYGHDATIAEIRRGLRPGVRLVGHGSGMGVAWVSSAADLSSSARALANDVVAFDQRGCLSPRLALVQGPPERASSLAEALHEELGRLGAQIPRGPVPAEVRAESERYLATMSYAGRVWAGEHHAMGLAPPGSPMIPAPPYRHVHITSCPTIADARSFLAPVLRSIVAVGSDDVDGVLALAPDWARVSPLGEMQRPRLDGPVDRRV